MSVFLFPGQGIVDEKIYAKSSPYHEELIGYVEDLVGEKITSGNYLTHAINSPLTVAHSLSCFFQVTQDKEIPSDAIFAGYSVGHFSALCASGKIGWKECLTAVFKRALLMLDFANSDRYCMLALIGPDSDLLNSALRENAGSDHFSAGITNFNSPINHSLAGEKNVLEKVLSSLPKEKVVKAVWMENLGPWHSPILKSVLPTYNTIINQINFSTNSLRVVSNVTGKYLDQNDIAEDLRQHLISPVQWHKMITELRADNQKVMYECGDSNQLTKMIFFSYRDIKCKSYKDYN